MNIDPRQVLPFSTGVILGAPADAAAHRPPSAAVADLKGDHWATAAEAIMTTDTVPRLCPGA
jgi:glutamate N-acetyltransferase/amino-acid N-acetyltransferase